MSQVARADRVFLLLTLSYLPGPWIYLAATLLAFVSPTASAALFGAIALFYVLESSLFGGGRARRRDAIP